MIIIKDFIKFNSKITLLLKARVAKLVDALDSGSSIFRDVLVQLQSRAQIYFSI